MKILVLNGNSHMHGCTEHALSELEKVFVEHGINVERIKIGNKDVRSSIGCNFSSVRSAIFFIIPQTCRIHTIAVFRKNKKKAVGKNE